MGALFLFEVLSVIPGSHTEAGELPLGLFNCINGLFLGVDSPFTGSDVHITSTGPGGDDSVTRFLQTKAVGQGLYTNGPIWLLLGSCHSALTAYGIECQYNLGKDRVERLDTSIRMVLKDME